MDMFDLWIDRMSGVVAAYKAGRGGILGMVFGRQKLIEVLSRVIAEYKELDNIEKEKFKRAFAYGFFLPIPSAVFVVPFCLRRKRSLICKTILAVTIMTMIQYLLGITRICFDLFVHH